LQALQKAFETNLNYSSSYHLKTDGQTKKVNKILEDMVRACVLEFQERWEDVPREMGGCFPTTTVTNPPLRWLVLKPCTKGSVEPLYVGTTLMRH